ncbi:hypothetical protein R1flu_001809 [Riccia fluitans]|uniref:Uncharacterized protein n=1 Tax=Riccia fluitans TaxID=41844 RepID=A0ABD1Y8B1_9MARC
MAFPTIPAPLSTIGGSSGGGSEGGGFGPISLPGPRQDFSQAINAARSVNRFKGDGVTKPNHHLKNFGAVMQSAGILDHSLWIAVLKTTLVVSEVCQLSKPTWTRWTKPEPARSRLQSANSDVGRPKEEYQPTGPPKDDKESVGDTPEMKVNFPWVGNMATPPRRRGLPRKDRASPTGVSRLVGELVPQQRLGLAPSKSEPARAESSASSTPGETPPEGSSVSMRAVRACYVPPMILVQIGDVIFPRVLVDTGSGVNVMSNQIRIRLGYHRMTPLTTKLAMADNTLVWPLGILSAVPVVVEGIRLIVSFQPYIVLVAEVNLVPLTDEEKQKELRRYLKSIKRKMKLDYRDMKDIPPEIVEHEIDLLLNTRPIRSQRYRLNPNYAERVKKELDN